MINFFDTPEIRQKCVEKGINLDSAYIVKFKTKWIHNGEYNGTNIIEWQTMIQRTIQPHTVGLFRSLDNMIELASICDDQMMNYLLLKYGDYIQYHFKFDSDAQVATSPNEITEIIEMFENPYSP